MWLLPPLFVLWANLHGSWLIGMVLFWVFFATGFLQGSWGRIEATPWTRGQRWKLALVGGLAWLDCF